MFNSMDINNPDFMDQLANKAADRSKTTTSVTWTAEYERLACAARALANAMRRASLEEPKQPETPEKKHLVRLIKTCEAYPEEYDAYLGTVQIGYLRLRHGLFTVNYPDVGGEEVYWARPKGEGYFDKDERKHRLWLAVDALMRKHTGEELPRDFDYVVWPPKNELVPEK